MASRTIIPVRTSLATNTSAFSKSGYSHAEPFNQHARVDAPGSVTSRRSRRLRGSSAGMNVPSLKRMPIHSPSAGQAALVAFVSGPRSVRKVLPWWRVTAISTWLAATERNVPARSLCERQMRSTNGESDNRSSKFSSTAAFP